MLKSVKKIIFSGLVCGAAAAFILLPSASRAQQAKSSGGGTIKGTVDSPFVQRYQALVYIDHVDGTFPPPKINPHMSQKGLVFQPHILPVVKGSTVDFTNDDTVSHNVFAPPGSATSFNLGVYGPGVKKTETFNNLGEVDLLCTLHPDMSAFVIVLQNPYFALADPNGSFEIDNVPPGTYQVKVWDEKLAPASQQVTVAAGKTATVQFRDLAER